MNTIKYTARKLGFVIFLSLIIWSCSGDDGVDGATGPQGAQGTAGTDGVDGTDGTNGEDGTDGEEGTDGEDGAVGTANVIYSDWIDNGFPFPINAPSSSFDIEAPNLQQEIIDNGVVMVFGRTPSGAFVYQLPIVFGASVQISYYFRVELETVSIRAANMREGEDLVSLISFAEYRYVIIPGGREAGGGGGITSKAKIDYTTLTYAEIAAHFNIPD